MICQKARIRIRISECVDNQADGNPRMGFTRQYAVSDLSRQEFDNLAGAAVVEFGNPWCGHCRRAEPLIEAAFAGHHGVRHIRISDASGRRLGRSFQVKLWPTLIFLRDGDEIARLVRPQDPGAIDEAFDKIDPNGSSPSLAE
jgi:thioredoxin 1